MSGYSTYTRWKRIEEHAKKFGFRLGNPKHGWGNDSGDTVAIFPIDAELPIYTRDAEIFAGTFRELEVFLVGWERAQQYDMILRMTDDKRRKKFEDAERERQRIAAEKLEQKKVWDILKGEKSAIESI